MTVKVYFVREVPEPTKGDAAYELALTSCIDVLGLEKRHWISDPNQPRPKLGNQQGQSSVGEHYKHVVCEIDKAEAIAFGWKAGVYLPDISPEDAIDRLGPPRLS